MALVKVEYSTDGGKTWILYGYQNSWGIPEGEYARAAIWRLTQVNAGTVSQ